MPRKGPDRLLGPMTGRRAVMWCAVFACVAMLGGCQVVGSWMDAGWSETKSVVQKIPGLRPAPRDVAVFAGAQDVTGDAGLNTGLLARKVWVAEMGASETVSKVAVDRTLDNGVMVFRPGASYRGSFRRIDTRYGATPVVRRPVQRPQAVQRAAPEAVSYVKVDGSLDMGEWTACEAEVGGAWLVSRSGTTVAPDFDACMRARGYVSEAEADAILASR